MTPPVYPPPSPDGGWVEFKHLILASLQQLQADVQSIRQKDVTGIRERIDQAIDDVRDRIDTAVEDMRNRVDTLRREDLQKVQVDIAILKTDVVTLRTKLALWSGIGGVIGGALITTLVAKFVH
jgi:signal transduction histidine kinase